MCCSCSKKSRRPPMPWLAALVCCSAFDVALHDAYGVLHGVPTYETYTAEYMNRDLASYLEPLPGWAYLLRGQVPRRLLRGRPARAGCPPGISWAEGSHRPLGADGLGAGRRLSGAAEGLDRARRPSLPQGEAARQRRRVGLRAAGPRREDGHRERRRLADGRLQLHGRRDGLRRRDARPPAERAPACLRDDPLRGAALPYDLERQPRRRPRVSARKPLFMDESAHDWRLSGSGALLGWTGVALKTCKTQTGALLSCAGRRRTA
jgi:hypothetical protein